MHYYSSMVIHFIDDDSFIQSAEKNALNVNFNKVYEAHTVLTCLTHTKVSLC